MTNTLPANDPLEEPVPREIRGVFDDFDREVFTRYHVAIHFTERVFGGIPQDPRVIEGWLRKRVLGGDEAIRVMLRRTLDELDIDIDPAGETPESLLDKAIKEAAKRSGNTFRRDRQGGWFLSDYNIKAMLKEATAICYPWIAGEETVVNKQGKEETRTKHNKWGPTKKTPRDYLAEVIFVDEGRIYLGRWEADGTHMQIGKVKGPQGTRSTLTYIDYCFQPTISFTISSRQDRISQEQWRHILTHGQRLGLGAVRSLSHGQFKVTAFDRLDAASLPQAAD